MIHWGWLLVGWILLSLSIFPMAWVLHRLHRDEKIRLRVALGDLVRAVEEDEPETWRGPPALRALERARDALSDEP